MIPRRFSFFSKRLFALGLCSMFFLLSTQSNAQTNANNQRLLQKYLSKKKYRRLYLSNDTSTTCSTDKQPGSVAFSIKPVSYKNQNSKLFTCKLPVQSEFFIRIYTKPFKGKTFRIYQFLDDKKVSHSYATVAVPSKGRNTMGMPIQLGIGATATLLDGKDHKFRIYFQDETNQIVASGETLIGPKKGNQKAIESCGKWIVPCLRSATQPIRWNQCQPYWYACLKKNGIFKRKCRGKKSKRPLQKMRLTKYDINLMCNGDLAINNPPRFKQMGMAKSFHRAISVEKLKTNNRCAHCMMAESKCHKRSFTKRAHKLCTVRGRTCLKRCKKSRK